MLIIVWEHVCTGMWRPQNNTAFHSSGAGHLIFCDGCSHRDLGLAITSTLLTIPSRLCFMNLKFILMQEGGWNIDYFSPNELEVSLILLTEETIFPCLIVNVTFIIM